MKRLIPLILVILVLLAACTGNKSGDNQPVSIRDALQIKAYEYDKETDSYTMTTLALNEPVRIRHGGGGMVNTNLQFCYDGGVCEVTSGDEDIQLSIDQNGGYWAEGDLGETRVYGYSFTVGHEGWVTLYPIAAHKGWVSFSAQPELKAVYEDTKYERSAGREYCLTVKAKDYDKTMIEARLKLVQLWDSYNDENTGIFTIELISYEYSDMYAIMEGAQ